MTGSPRNEVGVLPGGSLLAAERSCVNDALETLHDLGYRHTANMALEAALTLEEEHDDAVSALVYIAQRYGRLDGVGWDRVLPS